MPIGGIGATRFRGSIVAAGQYTATATVPSTATTVNGFIGSVSVPGAVAGDIVLVTPAVAQTAGVGFLGTVTAAGVIAITDVNGSGGTYNPGAQVFNIVVLRIKLA